MLAAEELKSIQYWMARISPDTPYAVDKFTKIIGPYIKLHEASKTAGRSEAVQNVVRYAMLEQAKKEKDKGDEGVLKLLQMWMSHAGLGSFARHQLRTDHFQEIRLGPLVAGYPLCCSYSVLGAEVASICLKEQMVYGSIELVYVFFNQAAEELFKIRFPDFLQGVSKPSLTSKFLSKIILHNYDILTIIKLLFSTHPTDKAKQLTVRCINGDGEGFFALFQFKAMIQTNTQDPHFVGSKWHKEIHMTFSPLPYSRYLHDASRHSNNVSEIASASLNTAFESYLGVVNDVDILQVMSMQDLFHAINPPGAGGITR